ncbi:MULTISPECIES: hypothetical protein [Tenebrionibacter/Tenebrionicola group]|uniref:Uncharacterized protein n=2 Tax=Tenebrionibacter/Tenebrionicola group TaxID=2969848 RepID=A0A8K0XWB5_9ENTR|nr:MULTISPECIES: hypothetical protein [Tenebrionibacter/Tenebrionicola group]MBK4714032.1 hypothetical protein [Tenebrionibacter intestinalis]MBV5094427.1 hypothetical protein [Tenebrionicola larvae]
MGKVTVPPGLEKTVFTMRGLSRLAQPYANGYSEPALMADGLDVVQQRGDGLVAVFAPSLSSTRALTRPAALMDTVGLLTLPAGCRLSR